MPTNFLWGSVGTVMNLLTTELNSLANGTISALGPEINNSNGYQMGQIYISLASAAFVVPSYVGVYFMPSNNTAGGSYETLGTAAQTNLSNYLAAVVYIKGTTAAQTAMLPYVPIPLGKFKAFALTGGSCPTLGASGNTVDIYPTPSQY